MSTVDRPDIDHVSKIKSILLADDHRLFREGFVRIIAELDPAAEIVQVESFHEAWELCERGKRFDLTLLDFRMPGMSSDGIHQLKDLIDGRPIVVVSSCEDRPTILDCLGAGAAGYLPKTLGCDVLLQALQLILSGGVYIPKEALGPSPDAFPPTPAPKNVGAGREVIGSMTRRQYDVLRILAEGQSNKEIARRLNVTESTVKQHVKTLLRMLGAANRTAAARKVYELELFRDNPDNLPVA